MGEIELTQPTQQAPTQATQQSATQIPCLALPDRVCRLICTQGSYDAFDLVLSSDKLEWLFGRLPDSDLRLTSSLRISSNHFKVWLNVQDKSLWIRDSSTNGTLLNGTRLVKGTNYMINQGDEIAVGAGVPADVVRFVVLFSETFNPAARAAQNADTFKDQEGIHRDYIIGHESIGQGAFATVKKAVNRATAKSFAVKIINRRKALNTGGAGGIDGVERELSILQKLHHPNIVALEEFYEDADNYYIVMELVPGGDLMDFVAANGAIGEDATQVITKQILEGIAYVHALGISHRDLKPDNILIKQDDPILVKITDFGLAKFSDNSTFMKTFCGTLAYVAPEVITGKYEASQLSPEDAQYSNLVDIWSLGCLVYVLLTLHLPFNGKNQAQMFQKIKRGEYHDAPLNSYEVSDLGRAFLKACLQVDPRMRMTAKQALNHEWLKDVFDEDSPLQKVLSLSQSQSQQLRKVDNGLSISMSMSKIDEDVMVRPLDRTNKKPRNDFKVPKRVKPLPQSQPLGLAAETPKPPALDEPTPKRKKLAPIYLHLDPLETSLLKGPVSIRTDKPAFVIGRINTCDLSIEDDRISKIHCLILRQRNSNGRDETWLLDASTNSCLVNSHSIGKGKKIRLHHNDSVYLFLDEQLNEEIGFRVRFDECGGFNADADADADANTSLKKDIPVSQNDADAALIQRIRSQILSGSAIGVRHVTPSK